MSTKGRKQSPEEVAKRIEAMKASPKYQASLPARRAWITRPEVYRKGLAAAHTPENMAKRAETMKRTGTDVRMADMLRGLHTPENHEKAKIGRNSSPKFQKAMERSAEFLRSPQIIDLNAKRWHFKSPRNVVYDVVNLSKFVRENPELFDPATVVWKPMRKGSSKVQCSACRGLMALKPRENCTYQRGSWMGWTWVSMLEVAEGCVGPPLEAEERAEKSPGP